MSTLTAFGLAVEIGDWHRFTGATIGAYLGLVPTESLLRGTRSQGSITKTGNTHARRLLVEAAWHHRAAYRPSAVMRARWELAPPAARARGHAGNHRLHHRWVNFTCAARSGPSSPTSPSPASWPAGAGPWPSCPTGLDPGTGGPSPSPAVVCRRCSVSTSFMLAALRVLHVDTSGARAEIRR